MVHGKRQVTPLPPVPATPVKKKRADVGATQSSGAPGVQPVCSAVPSCLSRVVALEQQEEAPAWCGWSWQ